MDKLIEILKADEEEYQQQKKSASGGEQNAASLPAGAVSGGDDEGGPFPAADTSQSASDPETVGEEGEEPAGVPNTVQIEAYTIEDALVEASEQLDVSMGQLDYEILEQGSRGFFGIGRKPYLLAVTALAAGPTEGLDPLAGEFAFDSEGGGGGQQEDIVVDRDGEVLIRPTKDGINLIVKPPLGNGKPATVNDVNTKLFELGLMNNVEAKQIEEIVNASSGEKIKIGEWMPNEENDSQISIEISNDEMRATGYISPPKQLGRYLEEEDIKAELEAEGVVVGIKEDTIKNIVENDVFNQRIMLAEGEPAVNGEDARVDYKFRTSQEAMFEEDEKGQIDFHEQNKVENVVQGQELAVFIPAKPGEPGRTVTNKLLEATDGKDMDINNIAGKNTEISEDETKVIASVNGQVLLKSNRISVEPIYEVHGDVDLNVGNIVFLGRVIVTGNVEDGFSIKASSDVEIRGSVQRAVVESEENVIISNGVLGRDLGEGSEAVIIAQGNVRAKFTQNARITAGRTVYIGESSINCMIDASKDIIMDGKRGQLTGGRARASEEINVKILGAQAYTETVVEAGIDPKSREELMGLENQVSEKKEAQGKINKDVTQLQIRKEEQKGLSEEKEEKLNQLLRDKKQLQKEIEELEKQADEIKGYLSMVGEKGSIAASKEVHPGVKIMVKNATLDVRDPFKFQKFIQDGGNIRPVPYEEPREYKEEADNKKKEEEKKKKKAKDASSKKKKK